MALLSLEIASSLVIAFLLGAIVVTAFERDAAGERSGVREGRS
jgi:hypothetical protein